MEDLQSALECSFAFIEKLKEVNKDSAALRSMLDLKAVSYKGFANSTEKIVKLCTEIVESIPYAAGTKIILNELKDATQNRGKPEIGQHPVTRNILKVFHAKHMQEIE